MLENKDLVLDTILNKRTPEIRDNQARIDSGEILLFIQEFKKLLFPSIILHQRKLSDQYEFCFKLLSSILSKVNVDEVITSKFIANIPQLIDLLDKDIDAIYNGDPSSKSKAEIVLCYPGFGAIFGHRVAHILYQYGVPIIPRVINEFCHSKTGIDIHPGASIGEYFCIDHGTGVVIGETATIGNHVRIYHGVTLGVKNFLKDENNNLLKGYKRHPDVGNNVIIYANATIMGNIKIGDNSIIGANAVVTEDVKEGSII